MTLFWTLFFGTFALEDVAVLTGLQWVELGKIGSTGAFTALFFGIAAGDLGLYFIGRFIGRLKVTETSPRWIQFFFKKINNNQFSEKLTLWIFISRFIPGTRVPTYLVSGFSRYSFALFFIFTVISVGLWVSLALGLGWVVVNQLKSHWLISTLVVFLIFSMIRLIVKISLDPWKRKIFFNSWRKWTSYEFWPAWFFYIPIVPFYTLLGLRFRNFFLPFYANPAIPHGGLLGESKWQLYKDLKLNHPSTLKTFLLSFEERKKINFTADDFNSFLTELSFTYPVIFKPDVGQRGFGVRIIRNATEALNYLSVGQFDIIIQSLSQFPEEAGLFYIRHPHEAKGRIFSITTKAFPSLITDGKNNLGDLILADTRARIMPGVYLERHKENLETIFPAGTKILLSECGNHCQGAQFFDGRQLTTPQLADAVDEVAKSMPHFYFGRFDVRYDSNEKLQQGQNFEIVEVNGAGSEATHIWDPNFKLIEAYKTLWIQWRELFQIGHEVKKMNLIQQPLHFFDFLKDVFGLSSRPKELETSS